MRTPHNMNVHKIITTTGNRANCILRITGNSRFRILNDCESGMIDKKYITYTDNMLYLEVTNPDIRSYDIFGTNSRNKKKLFYMAFGYKKDVCPCIEFIWSYNGYTPLYVLYPISKPTKETCETFGIPYDTLPFDDWEMSKNNRIMDMEYIEYLGDKRSDISASCLSPFNKPIKKRNSYIRE